MTPFITRAYNSISFSEENPNILIKTSKESRLFDEIKYYQSIPSKLRCFFPSFIDGGKFGDNYTLALEFLAYDNFFNLIRNNLLDYSKVELFCFNLSKILSIFSEYKNGVIGEEDKHSMFVVKTQLEYCKLVRNFEFFKKLSKEKDVRINGKIYRNLEQIWPEIIDKFLDLLVDDSLFNFGHFDLCFSNILCGFHPNGFCNIKFIDPRGSFGKQTIYGDQSYDLAKLQHSFLGRYEFFIYDLFRIKQNLGNDFSLDFHYLADYDEYVKIFSKFFHLSLKTKLLMGFIFIGMCARHFDSFDRQLGMYLTGIKILNECLE